MAHPIDEPGETSVARLEWLALGVIVAGAVALRLLYIDQPMRYDEAFSYLYYASPSLRTALSDYTLPNNHVFHTTLVWATTRVLGHSPEAIRLPVLAAGILAVPAAWVAGRAIAGRGAGLFAAATVAALPSLILYSTNARAYMLVCLATLFLVWLGSELLNAESRRLWTAFVVISALGLWATPVMLYPLGVVGLWLVVEHARQEGAGGALRFAVRMTAAGAAIAALTVLLYMPLIMRGFGRKLVSNRFLEPLGWPAFMAQLAPFARGLRELIALGIPDIVAVIGVSIALAGIAVPGRHRAQRVTLALSTVAWCCVLLLITRRPPSPRMWLFLAPLWCLYVGSGLYWVTQQVSGSTLARRTLVSAAGGILVAGLLGARAVQSRAVLETEETDWIGMRDARDVAALVVAGRPDDRVVINRVSGPPLDYYLYYLTGRRLSAFTGADRRGRVLLILDERHGQTLEGVRPLHPDVAWQDLGHPSLVRKFGGASVYAFSAQRVLIADGGAPGGNVAVAGAAASLLHHPVRVRALAQLRLSSPHF